MRRHSDHAMIKALPMGGLRSKRARRQRISGTDGASAAMMVRGRLLRVDSEWADDAGGISRVRYQRGERRKVDATRSRHRQRGRQAHGRQSAISLEAERDWLLARLDQKPDLTLHALRERGVCVSWDRLWHFLKRQEISFKKTL